MQLFLQAGDLGPTWFHVALRSLVLMAESEDLLTSNQIAEKLGTDATYVRKILAKLIECEYVQAHAGRYGGYCLNKEPKEISFKDIYLAFSTESMTPYSSVPSTGYELYISLVILKAEQSFQSILKDYTIQDVIEE